MRHPVLLTTTETDDWRALRHNSVLASVAVARQACRRSVFLEPLVEELALAHLVITDVQHFDPISIPLVESGSPAALRLLLQHLNVGFVVDVSVVVFVGLLIVLEAHFAHLVQRWPLLCRGPLVKRNRVERVLLLIFVKGQP